jgi:hypothetical protein
MSGISAVLIKDKTYLCCATSAMGVNKNLCTFFGLTKEGLPLFTSDTFYTPVMSDSEPGLVVAKIPCPFILDPATWSFHDVA